MHVPRSRATPPCSSVTEFYRVVAVDRVLFLVSLDEVVMGRLWNGMKQYLDMEIDANELATSAILECAAGSKMIISPSRPTCKFMLTIQSTR